MSKLTTNLIVPRIEDCLPFWLERVGFEKTVEVPHGEALGLVILVKGNVELMLTSEGSFAADVPLVAAGANRAVLYFEVDDLEAAQKKLGDWPLVVAERTTPYGARETICKDPAGNVVFFSKHG